MRYIKRGLPLSKKQSYWGYIHHYSHVVDTPFGKKIVGNKPIIAELRTKLEPFMLRRRKSEVLPDLPALRYSNIYVDAAKGDAATLAELQNFVAEHDVEELFQNGTFNNLVDGPLPTIRRLTEKLKVPGVIETVKTDLQSGVEKIIIFATHLDSIDALINGLSNYKPVHITGSVSQKNREAAIDAFHNGNARIFVGQITAAGVGLTLHAHGKCSDIIFTSLDFVPATNWQAAQRIHRIGQPNSVLCRVATLAGSVDEKVTDILIRKIQMINDIIEMDASHAA